MKDFIDHVERKNITLQLNLVTSTRSYFGEEAWEVENREDANM
jgi:hypothetical protein